jgi:AraC-like DNA-binding protein
MLAASSRSGGRAIGRARRYRSRDREVGAEAGAHSLSTGAAAGGANVARVVWVDAASRRMLRARDRVDRCYDKPLDVAALARVALTSEAHFIRTFKDTFGETPHRYLQRRRLERAMALLRETERPVSEICLDVGFTSLGSFSRTFSHVIGMSPTAYREAWRAGAGTAGYVPTCVVMAWTRPTGEPRGSSFGEAKRNGCP